MPSACDTKATTAQSNNTNSSPTSMEAKSNDNNNNKGVNGGSGTNGHAGDVSQPKVAKVEGGSNGFTEEDVDDEMPVATQQDGKKVDPTTAAATADEKAENGEDNFIFIQDAGFTIKIAAPGVETFELLVSPMEMVQEITHMLIEREDTCHRTCFSLQLEGQTLDNFSEMKSVEGLKEGSVIKVVEEPYTVREARIHVRHIRDLLKSCDFTDAYNGLDCNSLAFMNIIAQSEEMSGSTSSTASTSSNSRLGLTSRLNKSAAARSDSFDYTPPDYIFPVENNSNVNGAVSNGTAASAGNEASAATTSSPSSNDARLKESALLTPLEPQSKDQLKAPSALKVLTQSGWNPPPGARRLRGDLMYLYVVTLEEKRLHITACTRGFYVNQSTDEVFNPKAANSKAVYHSLVDLLSNVSPLFRRNFQNIQRRRHQRHPFERLATPYQVYAWAAPQLEHTVDSIRAEDAFSSKLGYEEHMPGQTRDWNEEMQTTRELPRSNLTERIMRERAIFKVHSDFVSAATRGAMAVVDGNVMALNPSEDTKMQMFIWNNIFFSLGFDVREHYKELGGDAAAFVAPCNDLHGVRAYSSIDIKGLFTLATAVIDYKGYRVTAQSIIPGILERDQEQSVVYGSIDFGKTVVSNPKYGELLNEAASQLKIVPHKVISKDDEVVEIHSSVECKGIIGNDGRHYILDLLRTFPLDPNFIQSEGAGVAELLSADVRAMGFPRKHRHKLGSLRQELLEAFYESRYVMYIKLAALYLQKIGLKRMRQQQQSAAEKIADAPKKEEGEEEEGGESKAKAIDGEVEKYKKFVEALTSPTKAASAAPKATAEDVTTAEKESPEKNESEVVAVADEKKAEAEESKSTGNEQPAIFDDKEIEYAKSIIKKAAADIGSLDDTEFEIAFNPDIFSPTVKHAEPESEAYKRQRKLIIDAAEFLLKVQLPNLVRDSLDHSIYIYDGLTLTDGMHSRGINMRYLGKLIELVAPHEKLDYLLTIAVCELVCRSAKHLFAQYIQGVEMIYLATAASHFLNCLLSSNVSNAVTHLAPGAEEKSGGGGGGGKKKNKKSKSGGSAAGSKLKTKLDQKNFEWCTWTGRQLWSALRAEMSDYYGCGRLVGGRESVVVDSLDSLLHRYGIQKVSLLRLFCIRTGVQIMLREYHFDHKTRPTFGEDDILNIFPVVRHITPRATDAYQFFQTGHRKIQEGNLREGYDFLTEALNLFNNVYGPLHSDIVQCLRLLGRINYVLGEYQDACSFQQKAVLMSEKINGIDHPHTFTEYNTLALYSFANGQVSASLKFLYRSRYLFTLVHGENHPDISVVDSNTGLILHAIGEYEHGLRFLWHALHINLKYLGERDLKTAFSYHLIARTLSCTGDFRGALNNEKETYSIYKHVLGEQHEKTRESRDCLRHLTNQAVVLQKKMNEIYKGNANAIIPPLQIQPPSLSSILEMLNVINSIVFVQWSAVDSKRTTAAAAAAATITDAEQTEATGEEAKKEDEKPATSADGTDKQVVD